MKLSFGMAYFQVLSWFQGGYICFNFHQQGPVVGWERIQESPPPPLRLKSAGALRGNVPEAGFEIAKFWF